MKGMANKWPQSAARNRRQKKTRSRRRVNASSGFNVSRVIMKQTNQFWQEANRQIAHLPNIKNAEVRRRQIVMICEALKRAMRGGRK